VIPVEMSSEQSVNSPNLCFVTHSPQSQAFVSSEIITEDSVVVTDGTIHNQSGFAKTN
jgi:hypothetical protein